MTGDVRDLEIATFEICQHGDLHGANLFAVGANDPFLIDFAYTGPLRGCVDPVSLELSMLFHPKSPFRGAIAADDIRHWWELGFLETLPGIGEISLASREWAATVGHSREAHVVGTMTYAVWILNHTDMPDVALALVAASADNLIR